MSVCIVMSVSELTINPKSKMGFFGQQSLALLKTLVPVQQCKYLTSGRFSRLFMGLFFSTGCLFYL